MSNTILSNTKLSHCSVCDKEILISKFNSQKPLCDSCHQQIHLRNPNDLSKKLYPGIHICETCGKEFIDDYRIDIGAIKQSPPRFCSKSCASKYSHKFTENLTKKVNCISCGKYFNVYFGIPSKTFKCEECKNLEKSQKLILMEKRHFLNIKSSEIMYLTLKDFSSYLNSQNLTSYQYYNILSFREIENDEDLNFRKLSLRESNAFLLKQPTLIKLGFDFANDNFDEEYFKIRNFLKGEYEDKCKPVSLIERENNIGQSSLSPQYFFWFGIKKRNTSESVSNSIKTGKLIINLDLLNESSLKGYSHTYKVDNHLSWVGKSFYLRSSYEKDLANKLDDLKINYTANKFHIQYFDSVQQKERRAYPDFYLPDYNMCLEVKSEYFYDPLNLKDRSIALSNLGIKFFVILNKKYILTENFPEFEDIKNNQNHYISYKDLKFIFT